MSKNSRKKQTRLNNLLIILILTALLLIMSTYAWFTANREVGISAIDLNVTTSNGLQISANGIDWKSVITKDDIAYAKSGYDSTNQRGGYTTVVNQLAKDIAPVSSPMTVDSSGHLVMYYGRVTANLDDPTDPDYGKYKLQTILQTDQATAAGTWEENESANYYTCFDFFLKLGNSDAANLYMTGAVTEEAGSEKGIANAARVALIEGVAGTGKTTSSSDDVVQGLTTVGGNVLSWEPNNNAHTSHGVSNHTTLGWYSPAYTITTGTSNNAIPWDGVTAAFSDLLLTEATTAAHNDKFATISPTWSTPKAAIGSNTVNNQMPNQLTPGVTKYRAYLWVEGQDVDCENYASGSSLSYELKFSLDAYQ